MGTSVKKAMAEFIGTFALVLIGCGSAVTGGGELGYLGIAFAFGLTIVAIAYAIGPVSGCHINPAVSLAMLVSRKMSGKDFFLYVVVQSLGAIAGAGLLYAIVQSAGEAVTSLGQNGFGPGYNFGISMEMALVVEVVLTFVFVYTILGVTSDSSNSSVAGLIIGMALVLVHILGIALTGTSVNPARSLGPALLIGGQALEQLWVFLVAPLIGAVLAAAAFRLLNVNKAGTRSVRG